MSLELELVGTYHRVHHVYDYCQQLQTRGSLMADVWIEPEPTNSFDQNALKVLSVN